MRDSLLTFSLFVVLGVLTITSVLYARAAESEAARVFQKLEQIAITSQNRCIIQVVLSYPPPISQEQYDVVLRDYDECIKKETASR